MTTITARRKKDGTLVQVMPDGSEQPITPQTDWSALDALTDGEVEAAAKSDPDNPPLTSEQLARMRPVAQVKRLRRKLRLSSEEFARRYHIPLEVIASWERHEAEPDAIALAYLVTIEADPNGVARALETDKSKQSAAE